MHSTAIPQSQQMQRHLMIDPSTSVHSLRSTAGGMVSPGMVPHAVTHPQATMHPMYPMHSMRSTGWGDPRHGGGRGQYGMMPGQYVNMARPGVTRMAIGQHHTPPHMITYQHSYNPAVGASVQPFSKLSAAVPQSPLMSPDPTLRSSSEQGVSSLQYALPPSQQPHIPPPLPQMSQTWPPHLRPWTLSPMDHTQSHSSLQPAATSSAPPHQTQQPETQSSYFKPHGHLPSSSRQQVVCESHKLQNCLYL